MSAFYYVINLLKKTTNPLKWISSDEACAFLKVDSILTSNPIDRMFN